MTETENNVGRSIKYLNGVQNSTEVVKKLMANKLIKVLNTGGAKVDWNSIENWNNSITQQVYNNTAEEYDEDSETQAFFVLEHKKVLEMLNIQDWQRVLDIWCWTGKYIKIFPKNIDIFWVDISEKMLQESLAKNPGIPVKYIIWDISKWLPFPNESFDKINCSHVLKFLTTQEDLEFAFQEISRVLKKWWTFVFTNNHPERNFDWEDYELVKTNTWNQDNDNIEVPMKLHKLQDYQDACSVAWLKAEEIEDVIIDQNLQSFLTPNSFEKVKWKRIILAIKLIKP